MRRIIAVGIAVLVAGACLAATNHYAYLQFRFSPTSVAVACLSGDIPTTKVLDGAVVLISCPAVDQ